MGDVSLAANDHGVPIVGSRVLGTRTWYPFSVVDLQPAVAVERGGAREDGGREEAAGQFRAVLDRWGRAKPRSRTAEEARAGLRGLGM
jgi:hypothetical protein